MHAVHSKRKPLAQQHFEGMLFPLSSKTQSSPPLHAQTANRNVRSKQYDRLPPQLYGQ